MGVARWGGTLSRRLRRGGGTSLPGLLALRVDPRILPKLSKKLSDSVIITGTNGKTTTANMLAEILRAHGSKLIHNTAGANLVSGLLTAMISGISDGDPGQKVGLFEVDEATIPIITSQFQPKIVAVTNIFRDQLDRYGELDHTAKLIRDALAGLDNSAHVVLNSDDPRVAALADNLNVQPLFFGVEDQRHAAGHIDGARDTKECLLCGAALEYRLHYFAHLGSYACPKCGMTRPEPQVKAMDIELSLGGTHFKVVTPAGTFALTIKPAGLYNVYNALAAIAVAGLLSIEPATIKAALEQFKPTFGRLEEVKIGDKMARLMLIKNPTGFNQVISALNLDDKPKNLIIAINDNLADGTDISWLWDADIERLGAFNFVIASGVRAEDMALRLKYAGFDTGRIIVENNISGAIKSALSRIAPGEELSLLATYTAMLEARGQLQKIGDIKAFWESGKDGA